MKDLLLRNGQFNWNFLLPVFIADVILHFAISVSQYTDYTSAGTVYTFFSTVWHGLYPVIWLLLWAASLKFGPTDRLGAIVVPGLVLSIFSILSRILTSLVYRATGQTSSYEMETMDIIQLVVNALIICTICEIFYKAIRNKLLLFIVAGFIGTMVYFIFLVFRYPSFGDIFYVNVPPAIVTNMYDYFLIVLIMALLKYEVPFEPSRQARQIAHLRKRIEEEISAEPALPSIIARLRLEFPDIPSRKIARVYTETADPVSKASCRTVNIIMVMLLAGSSILGLVMTPVRTYNAYGSFNLDDVGYFLLALFPVATILLRLKLATDLLFYKPYTYKVIMIAGITGCCYSAIRMSSSGNAVLIIEFIVYAAIAWMAGATASALYPEYGLLFKRKFQPEELGDLPPEAVSASNQ